MRRLRLFHFDLRTTGNYGDTLLFEAVRSVFHGVACGEAFDVYDSASLRGVVTADLISTINESADAVIVGGGGLFLGDTNPNARSGWQWNISRELLSRLEKPLIVFAVGNNRFIGQPEFADPFRDHVTLTVEKSIFFGLRNHGSMETIKQYLPEELRHRVAYQPCPTTLADRLYPDLAKPASDERVIGVQQIVGKRQQRARFSPDEVGRRSITVLRRLKADGWLVHGIPFARADDPFDQRLDQAGLRDRHTQLYGGRDALFRGVELFPSVPVMFGTRGHAQMVPFGMGSLPVSAMVHDKLRYFAEDIGRAHWVVDPRDADFEDRLYRVIHQAFENRAAERVDLDLRRSEFFALTLANVAEIYRSIAGQCLPTTDFVPYNARERRTVEKLFMTGVRQDELSGMLRRERSRLPPTRKAPRPKPQALSRNAKRMLPGFTHRPLRSLRRTLRRLLV